MRKSYLFLTLPLVAATLSSCVHEWPEAPALRPVELTVSHELKWDLLEYVYDSRAGFDIDATGKEARYIYEVYPAGATEPLISRTVQYSPDVELSTFTTSLDIPAGAYDIYVWNDYCATEGNKPLFYDAADFNSIQYLYPYQGCDVFKDCFVGKITVDVPESIDENVGVKGEISMKRPLTSYCFLTQDMREFVSQELTRRQLPKVVGESGTYKLPDLKDYKVTVYYTGYLPSEYSMLKGSPVYSKTGVSYTSTISRMEDNDKEGLLAFDAYFINGEKSNIRMAIEITAPDGEVVSSVKSLEIPVELNHCTIIKGNFLTQRDNGGVGIAPDFFGEWNIEIK